MLTPTEAACPPCPILKMTSTINALRTQNFTDILRSQRTDASRVPPPPWIGPLIVTALNIGASLHPVLPQFGRGQKNWKRIDPLNRTGQKPGENKKGHSNCLDFWGVLWPPKPASDQSPMVSKSNNMLIFLPDEFSYYFCRNPASRYQSKVVAFIIKLIRYYNNDDITITVI